MNYFNDSYNEFNANYNIENNNDAKIVSTKDIKKGEKIILKTPKKTNIMSFIMEGKTNENLVDYSPALYKKYEITNINYFKGFYVNILGKNFERNLENIYKKHAKMLNGDGIDIWAYFVVEMNLKFYKNYFESINLETIPDFYDDIDDRKNLERIIRGERKVVLNIYDKANKVLN